MFNISYDISAERVLDDKLFAHDTDVMHKAHVETLYIFGYFYGEWESQPEKIYKAALRLRNEGFNAEIIHVPFGHGGNALDPDNHNISLDTGKSWRVRKNAAGMILPTTTCPDDKCISDTLQANILLSDMGFSRIFLDDDCRLGMWGSQIQGCFCDECIKNFAEKTGMKLSREEISSLLFSNDTAANDIKEEWMGFQCDNLIRYLTGIKTEKIQLGVMLMHNGDRRHGIDIAKIRKAIPDAFFRVGEAHFSDCEMNAPHAEESILRCIDTHMALAGGAENTWSESTVYPVGAMSPSNWIRKIKLEIRSGLRNIYLMSGTRFLTDDYWEALENAYPELSELSRTPEPKHSIHEFIWS